MLSEHELVVTSDDILLVFWVPIVQVFNKFGFYQALLVKSLLVLEYLKCAVLAELVVIAFKHNTETTLAQLFNDFVSVDDMFINLA